MEPTRELTPHPTIQPTREFILDCSQSGDITQEIICMTLRSENLQNKIDSLNQEIQLTKESMTDICSQTLLNIQKVCSLR